MGSADDRSAGKQVKRSRTVAVGRTCKVTNGFRCEWGAETYAAFRSVVSTAKAHGASVFDTIRFVLAIPSTAQHCAGVG